MICHRKFAKWFCNGILLVIAVIVLALCLLNLVNPHLPEIRCLGSLATDFNILHKYTGDTIRTSSLLLVTFLAPLFQIFATEILRSHSEFSFRSPLQWTPWRQGGFYASKWFRDYVYGTIFLVLLNDICKSTLNSPRPHFVDSCKPNFTEANCQNGWVRDYSCTNQNITRWKLVDSHKSFPSAHAALGMFAAIFMMLYQHHRLIPKRHGVIVILCCHICWLGWAVFCSLSRVADFRHHPVDIVVGGILGIAGAIFTVRLISRNFRENQLDIYESQGSYPPPQGRMANGSATVIEGFISNSSLSPQSNFHHQSISMPEELNGSLPSGKPLATRVIANTPQRPSLRRLLSSQSTLTQMSNISEDRELEPI